MIGARLCARTAAIALVIAGLGTPSPSSAQRRSRTRSAFATALIDLAHLDPGAAARVEEQARAAVHDALVDPRSLPTNIVLRALIAEGSSYAEATARVEALAGENAAAADPLAALATFFATGSILDCSLGFHLRVQDCEAARAAVGGPPLDRRWEPGDGRAWADELVERGVRRRTADTLAATVSGLMASITSRPGAGSAALSLYRACPREGFAALERRRLWDAGASAEMVHCIAGWLREAGGRDGAALNLSRSFGVTVSTALRLHDLFITYDDGGAVAWVE